MTNDSEKSRVVGSHILLADDDTIVQMVTSRVLEQAGYTVDVVDNGLQAIKALETTEYAMVVMDCSMPEMDGFTATRCIRAADSRVINPQIPVIALTALSMEGDREKCFEAGMTDHVSKPVTSELLVAAIENCLKNVVSKESSSEQQNTPADEVWDDGFLDTIIDKFLDEVPQVISDLEAALEAGDVAGLKDMGHRIKGSADLLSATSLSARSRALEHAGRSGDIARVTPLTLELIKELQTLTALLTDE